MSFKLRLGSPEVKAANWLLRRDVDRAVLGQGEQLASGAKAAVEQTLAFA